MKTSRTLKLICFGILHSAFCLSSLAQGTAFTYQGRLNDGANPASGIYDLRFTIYNSTNLPGVVIAGPLTNAAVAVSDGLFTVTLDFGTGAFDGNPRWLEIGVRPAGPGSFTTLSLRQPVTAAPYAIRAASVANGSIVAASLADGSVTAVKLAPGAVSQLGAPDGSPLNAVQVNTNGLLGIGTTTPVAGMEIASASQILTPTLLAQIRDDTGGFTNLLTTYGVSISGNLLALGSQNEGITLVDISDPTNPVLQFTVRDGTGSFTNIAGAWGVALATNLLVVPATSDNAVTFISVTNPANPVILSTIRDGIGGFNELAAAYQAVLNGNLLAVSAQADSAITLMSVTNPANPTLLVTIKDGQFGFNALSAVSGLTMENGLLIAAAITDNAVTLIDVSNPSSPILRSVLQDGIGGFNDLSNAVGVARSGNLLAIAGFSDDAVTLVDISNPASPVLRSVLKQGVNGYQNLVSPYSVVFAGNLLVIAATGDPDALTFVDVSNPSAPVRRAVVRNRQGGFNLLDSTAGLGVSGNVLVAAGNDGLTLLDFSTTAQLSLYSQQWVAIGVDTPLAPLHVAGNVIVSDATMVDLNANRVELGLLTTASGNRSTAMGSRSLASGNFSTAIGDGTVASGEASTAMGHETTASGVYSTAMGTHTTASGTAATAMGDSSVASGVFSIAIGASTTASGDSAAVGGGANNLASGSYSTVPGGRSNTATNDSFAAGRQAKAMHPGTFVWADSQGLDFASTSNNQFLVRASGGVGIGSRSPAGALHLAGPVTEPPVSVNTADRGLVLGVQSAGGYKWLQSYGGALVLNPKTNSVGIGTTNPVMRLTVAGSGSFINSNAAAILLDNSTPVTGRRWQWQALDDGRMQFVDFSLGISRLLIETNGNVGIGVASPTNKLHVAGGVSATAFVSTSDRNSKENFAPVSPGGVLAKVLALPITTWNFKDLRDGRHMGPMAQDFYAAFHLGGSDATITTIDPDGVALAAIQGLNEKVEVRMQNAEVRDRRLEEKLEQKESEITDLKQRLAALESIIRNQ